MGIDLVLDTVQTGHQQGCIAEIGIAGGIGIADLKAAHLGRLGICGDTDDGAAVGCGITDGHGSLKAGHQTLEGVGAGVGDGAQRRNVLQQTADEIVSGLAQVRIALVIREHRLAILQ